MACLPISEHSLLETPEQNIPADVTITLLAEIERELSRLQSVSWPADWKNFCERFPDLPIFRILKLGTMTRNRLRETIELPSVFMDFALSEAFKARAFSSPSPAHLVNAWEYSLPISRSLRARAAFFSREIEETLRSSIKPRILILGGGRLHEADIAIKSAHLHHAEFVTLQPDTANQAYLHAVYGQSPRLCVEHGTLFDLSALQRHRGRFDLIYSPFWLDQSPDDQCVKWLNEAVEALRTGGRLLASNIAPGSRDAGWMESCWNWHPHCRSEEDLSRLMARLKSVNLRGHAMFRDESGASIFLEIHSL